MDDIIDVVVPRASMPQFFRKARELALAEGGGIGGCGHAGDGNVHLGVFCKDPDTQEEIAHRHLRVRDGAGRRDLR